MSAGRPFALQLLPLVLLAGIAACGRAPLISQLPLPRASVRVPATAAVPPRPVAKPAWVARKVVPNAVELTAGPTTVSSGEGVSQVAARTHVPLGALLAANGLGSSARLLPGQQLVLPGGRVHSVRPGETGIAIARAYGVDWPRVIAANRLVPPYTLEIGDRLLLPSRIEVASMSVEDRATAFRIDIDDLITGAEPAAPARGRAPTARAAATRFVAEGGRSGPAPASETASAMPPLAAPMPHFSWPLEGRVLSSFGAKPGGRFNDGVNLKTSAGTAVRAAADGIVAYAGDAVTGFGNLVLIKHADGWVSAYGHNEAVLVARGDRVRQGDVIARAGATGAVDEPQLHFELRRGRAAIDPVKVLPPRT